MSLDGFRVIGRPVIDRAQRIEWNDSMSFPCTLPDGRVVRSSQMACNFEGSVGLPASVFLNAGFTVYEQWLCEVRAGRVVRHVARVLGSAYAWPNERPMQGAA